jgi:hypothetical protein
MLTVAEDAQSPLRDFLGSERKAWPFAGGSNWSAHKGLSSDRAGGWKL